MDGFRSNSPERLVTTLAGLLLLPVTLLSQQYVPSDLLIKFNSQAPDTLIAGVMARRDLGPLANSGRSLPVQAVKNVFTKAVGRSAAGLVAPSMETGNTFQVLHTRFASPAEADRALQALQGSPFVEYVQRNYLYHVDEMPNDSAASGQWNLQQIGIFQLWASGFFDQQLPTVKVGVLDTGVDYLHPDISRQISQNDGETGLDANGQDKRFNGIDDDGNGFVDDWRGYDFVDQQDPDLGDWSTRDNDPMDENGHGTAVAGIIGAQSNNGIGIAGASPVARILPLRAFNSSGVGTDADIAAAIVYAADNGVQVLNMSFGDVISSPLLKDAIHYAYEKNVVLIASSGNDGTSYPHYPSDFSDVISVGSVTQDDVKSIFSSYGPSLALVAPGEGISTLKLGGGYQSSFSGTSAAAPHVSAVASLIISQAQASRSSKVSAPPLTNDEVKAELTGGATDLGDPGWDNTYGAGLVNARVLLSAGSRNVVRIQSPDVDAQLSASPVRIIGTANTDQLASVQLFYGFGDDPSSWQAIGQSSGKRFINDTLGVWDITNLSDGVYTLRLEVKNIQGGDVESRNRVLILRSTPRVLSFSYTDSVIYQGMYCGLATIRMDRPTTAVLKYRLHNSQAGFNEIASPGNQLNHYFLITPHEMLPGAQYDFSVISVDGQGRSAQFPTLQLAGTDVFTISLAPTTVPTTGFNPLTFSLPSGFLLNRTDTLSGKRIVLMNQYDSTGSFYKLKAFTYAGGGFVPIDSTARGWVPRDLRHGFGDARLTSLVQDQGVTEILSSNTVGSSLFSTISLAESTDVWASQLYDFDGDGKLDLIARSSTQYLIYQNMGENRFNLVARLHDPTPPLPGDAANQFGPPRCLVGDFSRTGNAEVIFADYDGDVVVYRQADKQTAPFQFQLIWTDTTSLYETSDFLAAGDFEGNGNLDFAVAGHSNLDLNVDREYDPPTWDIRIFSRRPTDSANTFSKIWDQTVFGVKTGLSYDNGLSTGRVLGVARDQLFLSLNPYLYLVDYNSSSRTFQPVWMHSARSNAVLSYDFAGDGVSQFGFNTGSAVEFFESAAASTRPQTPWNITAVPLTAHSVRVQWSSASPSGLHRVYRDTVSPPKSLLGNTVGTTFADTTAAAGRPYWYSVSLVGSSESLPSAPVMTIAHAPSSIDSAAEQSITQVSIVTSWPIDQSRLQDAVILLDDSAKASSIAPQSPAKLLLTFGMPISPGPHFLHVRNLVDLYGLEADTSQRFQFTAALRQQPTFYLRQASFASPSVLSLEFSDTIGTSGYDVSNYRFSNAVRVFALKNVQRDTTSPTRLLLVLQDYEHLAPVGFRMELAASEKIESSKGQPLNDGKGEVVSLAFEVDNLDQLMVFPDPVRYSVSDINRSHVTFANVPQYCRIDIFSVNGVKVTTLLGSTPAAGIQWDLNDSHGRPVGSGVYIYFATQLDQNNNEVRTKKGKLAIIR